MTLFVGGGMLLWIERRAPEEPGDLPPPQAARGPAARDPVVAALASMLLSAPGAVAGSGGGASGQDAQSAGRD